MAVMISDGHCAQMDPAQWVSSATGGNANGVFSSSWNIDGHGGGTVGSFGPGGSKEITLVDSATGQKVVLVNGCLPAHSPLKSEHKLFATPCAEKIEEAFTFPMR